MSLAGSGLNRAAALERYVAVMEGLRADNLDSLADVLTADARVVDPFNDVCGIQAIRAVFAHGFAQCPSMRFVVSARQLYERVPLLGWLMRRIRRRLAAPRGD